MMDQFIELPTEQSKIVLKEIIEHELGTKDYDFTISKGSNVGDNYIGIIYRVLATRKNVINNNTNNINESDDADKIYIIIKLPPNNQARREQFFARPCFIREAWIYDEIMPMFQQFQQSKGILLEENGFNEIAKCYRTITTEFEEGLYFEDLKVSGFEMFDRFQNVTIDHVKLVMNVLGKFHAISFALRDQNPKKFDEFKEIQDIFLTREADDNLRNYFVTLTDRAIKTLDVKLHANLIEKVNKLCAKNLMNTLIECVDGPANEPYSVLCHGDCWNNNILFKYKNGKPIDIRLLDWQISRYSSPICDLAYYIYGCTTKEFRDQYYDIILKTYHNSLSDFLRRLGSDPSKLFSYTMFQQQLQKYGKFGFIMAVMVLPVFTLEKDDVPNLDEVSERLQKGEGYDEKAFHSEKTDLVYSKRMRDVIFDMEKYGYF